MPYCCLVCGERFDEYNVVKHIGCEEKSIPSNLWSRKKPKKFYDAFSSVRASEMILEQECGV